MVFERGQDGLPAVLRHDVVKAPEAFVGHAAPVAEAGDDVVLHAAEERDVLREDGEIVARRVPAEARGVFRRQAVGPRLRVVLDDAADRHRAEPFADVALLKAGGLRDARARGMVEPRHRVEEPGAVSDRGHQGQGAGVQDVDEAVGERLGPRLVEPVGLGACLGDDCHDDDPPLRWVDPCRGDVPGFCTGSG